MDTKETELGAGAVQAIERIAREAEQEKAKLGTIVIDGETYVAKGLVRVDRPEWTPGQMNLATLQGLIDYVRDQPDKAFAEGRTKFLHIASPTEVVYSTGAGGPQMQRRNLAAAEAIVPPLPTSQMGIEGCLVLLRTTFVRTPAVDVLIDLLSHVDSTNAVTISDDGLSQRCVVNRGVRGKEGVTVPNPISLAPFRTFAEVVQPESPFLLRLHGGGEGKLPTVSLTEADMGQWRLAAIANIKAKLVDSLPNVAVYG